MSIKISDICDINSSNISSKDNYEFINYLDTSNLTEGVIDTLQKLVVGEDKIPSRAKRKVKKNDVLISTVRPNQKHYGILRKLKENLIVSTGFVVLSAKEDIVDAEYLYRYLTQDSITNYLQAIGETSTSAYPSIKPSDIGSLEIELPQLEEQKAIAKVLLDLDKKIEINNKINKKLEEMAQAIFKQWFVDFEFPNEDGKPYKSSGGEMVESELGMIPKGWEVTKIGECCKIIRGASPRPIQDFIDDKGMPWLKISDASDSNSKYILNIKEYIKEEGIAKSRKVSEGTLVLSNSATPGIAKIMLTEACVHDGWLIFSEYKNISKEYIYCYLVRARERILTLSNGSVFRNLKTDILKNYPVIIPQQDVLIKATELLISINENIEKNVKENRIIENIRSVLLPKLMLGEIRVAMD